MGPGHADVSGPDLPRSQGFFSHPAGWVDPPNECRTSSPRAVVWCPRRCGPKPGNGPRPQPSVPRMDKQKGHLRRRLRPWRGEESHAAGDRRSPVHLHDDLICPRQHRGRGFVRSSAFVDSSSCPSPSAWVGPWRRARVDLQSSEQPARRRATSAPLVHSLTLRVADASPRMSDHCAILPNPRGSSTCQQSLACLPDRPVGGVVRRPNPIASSRPSDACA